MRKVDIKIQLQSLPVSSCSFYLSVYPSTFMGSFFFFLIVFTFSFTLNALPNSLRNCRFPVELLHDLLMFCFAVGGKEEGMLLRGMKSESGPGSQ